VITNIVWWRNKGFSVETVPLGAANGQQSIERYLINEALHIMIRASPNNVKSMASRPFIAQVNHAPVVAAQVNHAPAVAAAAAAAV
jgi:hypothetical protein